MDPHSTIFNSSLVPICNKNPNSSDLVCKPPTMSYLTCHPFVTPSFTHPLPTTEYRDKMSMRRAICTVSASQTWGVAWLLLERLHPERFLGQHWFLAGIRMANQTAQCLHLHGSSGCYVVGFPSYPRASSEGNAVICLPFWSLTMTLGSLPYVGNAQLC